LHNHWRLVAAALCGVLAFAVAQWLKAPLGLRGLIAWNLAAATFLALMGPIFLEDQATVRARAADDDQGAQVITGLVISAVAASLAATFVALHESKTLQPHGGGANPWPVLLSVSTIALSWLVIQSVFTLRYAHAYFGDSDGDGAINGGVKFPGEPPKDYRDFIYMAVCVGCTSQVSDFNILNRRFRSLVTAHAIISFTFNVSILALGINMAASILSQ
jgi:uncharacterized membrane protein